MLAIPRLVLYTNKLDFGSSPRLGLVSLLMELGYTPAEDLVATLGNIVDTHSVYDFIDLYRVIGTDGIAVTSVLFNVSLAVRTASDLVPLLRSRRPRFVSGGDYIEAHLNGANYNNYAEMLDWLGYSYVDILTFIEDPLAYPRWINLVEPDLKPLNDALLAGNLYSFFETLLQREVSLAINLYPTLQKEIKRWINLSFNKYAFGADIHQADWFA